MYRSLLRDASLYSISTVLARGLSLITVPIFTRILSPSDYGALDLLSYMSVFFPLVFGLALDQGQARYFPSSDDDEEKTRMSSSVLVYSLVVLLLVVLMAMPTAEFLAHAWLSGQVDKATVQMAFFYMWIHSVFIVVNNQLRYMFLARKYALCSIGNTVVSMGLSVWFVAGTEMGVFGVFLAQAISQTIFSCLSFYYGRKYFAFIFDWVQFRKLLSYSLPLVPGTIAFMGMLYADRYLINEMRSLNEVGLYGIGARLASLINLFLAGFHTAWSPVVMKSFRDEGSKEKFSMVFSYYLFATTSILIFVSLFSEEVLLLLTTSVFSEGYKVVPLLISAAIMGSIGNYFTYGIQIRKKSKIRLYINIAGLCINITLNILLISRFGILGAALATFLSIVFMACASMYISQRLYRVDYAWPRLIGVMLIAFTVSHIVVVHPFGTNITTMIVKGVCAIATIIVIARLLDIKNVGVIMQALRKT